MRLEVDNVYLKPVNLFCHSTCVLAYLMMRQNMTAVEALTEVRRHREVRPNEGFLRQLADLDNKLRRERGQLS